MLGGGIIATLQKTAATKLVEDVECHVFDIYLVNNSYLVWKPEIVILLREKFGIVGTLIGTLPRKPRQNRVLGLPLEIMKEEAVLLNVSGVANIVRLQGLPESCSEEKYSDYLTESYKKQNEYLLESIFSKSQQFVEKPTEEPAHLNLTGDIDVTNPPYHVQRIFPRQVSEFWNCNYCTIDQTELSDFEKMRVVVLQDLRRRNYMVTSGSKFGGDFLVYPGDPLVYHAYFVVRVCSKSDEMKASELLALSRLASSVKKVAVIATVQCLDVSYLSLQWSGLK